ncbi:hypothetical protein HK103_005841 [Boothiomyces macroporosus]|uniref:AB hydrolase-1 domain-containing protein n=1 Tax=Boothiomyces macroporosus TaxID=261099 RepID=A0AAD5Y734_9FUNG|nr:hypothetical protein HK103_005841 [Boothiomyces macroporosus]
MSILSLVFFGLIFYLLILGILILFPFPFQHWAMYLNFAKFPFFVDFNRAEEFGFRSGSVKSFKIKTKDNLLLGAWHIFPHRFIPKPNPQQYQQEIDESSDLDKADIVFLYFHGNAGNRATFHRTDFYKMMTSLNINSHVIAIDYRGFGDSSFAIPTEKTVRIDAISAYDWIVDQGVNPRKIIIVGHSLATDLAYTLDLKQTQLGTPPCGGYASIADAAIGYPMVPVLLPFHGFPQLEKWIKSKIVDKWSSHLKMSSITTPILIMHGLKDFEIKPWQAEANFLEAISGRTGNKVVDDGYWEIRNRPQKAKFEHKDVQGLSITHLDHEGELWSLNSDENPVWLLRVTHAGHNNLSRHLVVKATIESWLENFPSK